MIPTQSSLTDSGSVAAGQNTDAIPNDSGNNVTFSHHSTKFFMAVENNNEITKVKCNGQHLISDVLQCVQDGHLMCRKCCFPSNSNEVNPQICPQHKTEIFHDKSTTRSISYMRVECPANKTFKVECPWIGYYKEVTSHLDNCTFIPGSARVNMQNAMLLKAVNRGGGQKLEKLTQEITHLRQMQRDSDKRIQALEKLLDESTRDLMQKYNEQEKLLQNVSLKLVVQQMAKSSSAATAVEDEIPPRFDGKLLWPINDYSLKRTLIERSAEKNYLESPPFFTSECGYKMRIRLYPNGQGRREGTHIGIFLQLLPGPFDQLLEWPFKEEITMKILRFDGKPEPEYSFKPNPRLNSYHRPEHEPNIPSGDPVFMSLTELEEGEFLRSETLFVQVSVGSK